MATDISSLRDLDGFIGAGLVDSHSGMTLAAEAGAPGFDLASASAANTEVIRSQNRALRALGLGAAGGEDILMSLSSQYHLIRPLSADPALFIYVALERRLANLSKARHMVKSVEGAITL